MSAVLVEVTRGPLAETVHRGDLAVVDAPGALLRRVGAPDAKVTFWRSAAKPFQAMAVVRSGAFDRFGFAAEDLALMSASHGGEPAHTERVLAMLARAGLSVEDLRCGPRSPLHAETARALLRAGGGPSALHSDCSGKHAGMLALALHLGADPADYRSLDHPVQREIVAIVCRVIGLTRDEIAFGVDGCGVPTFGISVQRMALAYARLADPSPLAPEDRAAALRVRDAMLAHPYFVAGTGRFCTELMTVAPGRIVAKGGASGVSGIGILAEAAAALPTLRGARGGVGIALKMEDGGPQGVREVAAAEALRQIGALDDAELAVLRSHARPIVRNSPGDVVGEARAVFSLLT